MTVTGVVKDPEAKTLTITAHLDAPVDRVWRIWSDPRQLERWWGPPTHPATVLEHDLTPGGTVTYLMTGPEGDQRGGWWRIRAVDPPRYLEFEDGDADAAGNPDPSMPTTLIRVTLTESTDDSTDMEITSVFPSIEAMEQLIAMGTEAGMAAAVGQIDELLAQTGADVRRSRTDEGSATSRARTSGARHARLDRLDSFIGDWREEVSVAGVPSGRMTFEWALDGQYLLQRSQIDDPAFPDGLCVIAPNAAGDSFTQHYFDARGVVRLYEMTLVDGVWTLLRDKPDFTPLSFSQRFVGTFSDDKRVIHGVWERSDDGGEFKRDFCVTYTKVA